MKLPERVGRRAFWTWVVPLAIAHVALSAAAMAGVNGMGALDAVIVIMLAALVALRFRDVGWRGWIGGSFVIATMLVAPLAVTAYTIAKSFEPAQFMEAMNEVGLIVGAANLALLAVSGSVRGSGPVDPIRADPDVDALQPPAEASSPSAAQNEHRAPRVVAARAGIMAVAAVAVAAVVGIAIALLAPRLNATSAPSVPSASSAPSAPSAPSASSAPSAGQRPGVLPNREPRPPPGTIGGMPSRNSIQLRTASAAGAGTSRSNRILPNTALPLHASTRREIPSFRKALLGSGYRAPVRHRRRYHWSDCYTDAEWQHSKDDPDG